MFTKGIHALALLYFAKIGDCMYASQASVNMDISMNIHGKSVDMDMNMDGKFRIHGKPVFYSSLAVTMF